MPYVLQPDSSTNPILKRIDHIISYVPDIERIHRHFVDVLGFAEAWPIGKFWPSGNTSGIALGGMNLEFVEKPGTQPIASTLVFEPSSIEAASVGMEGLGVQAKIFDKVEPDPGLLQLRGFSIADSKSPQLICRNVLLQSEFPVDMFFCDYAPFLKERLAPARFPMPYGRVLQIHLELPQAGDVFELKKLGYGGNIDIHQSDTSFGPCQITGIKMENGPIDLKGIDPGFSFI